MHSAPLAASRPGHPPISIVFFSVALVAAPLLLLLDRVARHPLMTPIGRRRATLRASPAW